jgi:hypothetical protein
MTKERCKGNYAVYVKDIMPLGAGRARRACLDIRI